MDAQRRKDRIKRLRALLKDQPEEELRTQFSSAVAELARLESESDSDDGERKAAPSRNRKKTGGRNRSA